MVIESMAAEGKEPTFCMGDDAPMAVLSGRGHMPYDYLKQRFAQARPPPRLPPCPLRRPLAAVRPPSVRVFTGRAQVTNPAIDPLREGLVMSLEMKLGKRGNLLNPGPESAKQVLISSPVLFETELDALMATSTLHASTQARAAWGFPLFPCPSFPPQSSAVAAGAEAPPPPPWRSGCRSRARARLARWRRR